MHHSFLKVQVVVGEFKMYNTSVYGFTYNEDATVPGFVDVIMYNNVTDELSVHKIIPGANMTVENSYRKAVKKETRLIEDLANGVGVYTTYHEVADGFFDIYIGGTVEHKNGRLALFNFVDPSDRDYFIAKFSTRYNYTEWYRHSAQLGINETVRGIHFDALNQLAYLIVEVKANKYLTENALYESLVGDVDWKNQTNIALIAYDSSFGGNRRYLQLLGSPTLNESNVSMDSFGNNLYVLLNRDDPPQSVTDRRFQIDLYEIRQTSGLVIRRARMGSSGFADQALDMRVNYKGIYILAEIGSYFCIEGTCNINNRVWDTRFNLASNLALILLNPGSSTLEILEIQVSGANLIILQSWNSFVLANRLGFLPSRFHIMRTPATVQGNDFVCLFMAQRTNQSASGLYFTVFSDNPRALQRSTGCTDPNCVFCSSADPSYCLQCNALQVLEAPGLCKLTPSAGFFLTTDPKTGLKYSHPCHYKCAACSAYPGCTACKPGMTLDASGECRCPIAGGGYTYESNGVCMSPLSNINQVICGPGFSGAWDSSCVSTCPSNSYPFYDFLSTTSANPRSQTRAATSSNQVMLLKTAIPLGGLELKIADLPTLPPSFTLSFWVIKKDDLSTRLATNSFNMLAAFGRVYFVADLVSSTLHCIRVKLQVHETSWVAAPSGPCVSGQMAVNKWVKVGVTVVSKMDSQFDLLYYVYTPWQATVHHTASLVGQSDLYLSPFTPTMLLGAHTPSDAFTFPGAFRELALSLTPLGLLQLQQDAKRAFRGHGLDTYKLWAYFPQGTQDLSEQKQAQNLSYPVSTIGEVLTLELWSEVALCLSVHSQASIRSHQVDRAVMRGEYLTESLSSLREFKGLLGWTTDLSDRVEVCAEACETCADPQAEIHITAIGTPNILAGKTVRAPQDLKQGQYYEVCYAKKLPAGGQSVKLPLGQVYVQKPIQYVYPFNRGVAFKKQATFSAEGGDIGPGDELVFTTASDCGLIDDAGTSYGKVVFTRRPNSTFSKDQFPEVALYQMCWRSAIAKDMQRKSYLQVNGFNYWMSLGEVKFSDNLSPLTIQYQSKFITFNLKKAVFLPGDEFKIYMASSFENCYIPYRLGRTFQSWNLMPNGIPYFPPMWFGTKIGVTGVSPSNSDLHICYQSTGDFADKTGFRIPNADGTQYEMKVTGNALSDPNLKYPEISQMFSEYAGTINLSSPIFFGVWPYPIQTGAKQIYPASHPTLNQRGKIEIVRIGVDQGGDLIETGEIIWQQNDLTHETGLQTNQGNVRCGATPGLCTLINTPLKEGEIYQLVMYSYSFFVSQGSSKYYLFGAQTPTVQPIYKHLFFVRGWSLEPPANNTVSFEQSYLVFKGRGLLYQNHTRIRGIMPQDVTFGNFMTLGINITFQVKKSVACSVLKPPHGTILQEDIQDDQFSVRDLSFNGCKNGELFASIFLWRGIKNSQTGKFSNMFVTNYLDFYMGTFGCHPDCLRCNGTGSNACLLCAEPQTKFLHQGQCLPDGCPPTAPYFDKYKITFNNSWWGGRQCREYCPEGTFPDHKQYPIYKAIPCVHCFPDCQLCPTDIPQSCSRCMPTMFNLKGMCLRVCPDNDLPAGILNPLDYAYQPNYHYYSCKESRQSQEMNQSAMINVTFVPMGYRRRIPKDQIFFFKASVANRIGNLTKVQWKQLDPIYDLTNYVDTQFWTKSELKNKMLFDGLSTLSLETGYLWSKFAYQKLRMSTFNYFKETDAFRFMVKVENTRGMYQIDVLEVGTNDPPRGKEVSLSIKGASSRYNNYTMETEFTISTLDPVKGRSLWSDTPDDTQQELSFKLYLETGERRMLLIPSTYQLEVMTFRVPHFNQGYQRVLVDLYLVAQDKFAASTSKLVQFMISNAYDHPKDRLEVLNSLAQLDVADPQSQLMISNNLETVFDIPRLPVSSGVRCLSDWHCFDRGMCQMGRCQCEGGQVGEYCQMSPDEAVIASSLSKAVLTRVPEFFKNHKIQDQYLNTDLEYLTMTLKGFTKSFETLDPTSVLPIVKLMHTTISAHLEVAQTFTRAFYDDFYETLSRLYGWIQYLQMTTNQYSPTLTELGQLAFQCEELFSSALLIKMNKQSFFDYYYESQYLSIRLYRVHAQELLNNTRAKKWTVFKLNEIATDIEVKVPPCVLEGQPEINEVSDLRVKIVKRAISSHLGDQGLIMETPIVEFALLNAHAEVINLSLNKEQQERCGNFEILMPYRAMRKLDSQSLQCKELISQNLTLGLQLYDSSNCANCKAQKIQMAVCFSPQGSPGTFGAFFMPIPDHLQIGGNPKLGLYTDFYAMLYWRESFGFIAVIGAVTLYFFGLAFSLVLDLQPQQRLRYKLMRDFRSFEAYLFKDQQEEEEEEKQDTDETPTGPKDTKLPSSEALSDKLARKADAKAPQDVATTNPPEEKKKPGGAKKKKARKIVLEDEITPQQTSHYDRGQMPISALRMLDEIFPKNKFLDLEEDGEDDKKYEGGEGEEDQINKAADHNHPIQMDSDNSGLQNIQPERLNGENQSDPQTLVNDQIVMRRERRNEDPEQRTPSPSNRQPRGGQQMTQARQAKLRRTMKSTADQIPELPQESLQPNEKNPTEGVLGLLQRVTGWNNKDLIMEGDGPSPSLEANQDQGHQNQGNHEHYSPNHHIQTLDQTHGPLNHSQAKLLDHQDHSTLHTQLTQINEEENLIAQKPAKPSFFNRFKPNFQFEKPKLTKDQDFDSILNFDEKKPPELLMKKTPQESGKKAESDEMVFTEKAKEEEEEKSKEMENEKREIEKAREERENKRFLAKEQEVLRLERETEGDRYTLLNMIKYGNPILNFLFVDSILFPRHARWTLLFINIMLIWFFCAIIYNNTKSPLDVPDFSKRASKLASQELWISLIAPVGNMVLMYLFFALFRISDQRIKFATNLASLKQMLNELTREMALRFLMAYFIAFAMFGAVSYYVLQFTSSFGWKISWAWFFSGIGAALMHFFVYDIWISIINWVVYRLYKPLGRFIAEVRSIKQAREEA